MTNSFQIRIGGYIAVAFEGTQLRLTKNAIGEPLTIKSRDPYATSLRDLNSMLVAKGILRSWEVQSVQNAEDMVRRRLASFEAQKASRPKQPLKLSMAGGSLTLEWNPLTANGSGGDWTLSNPGKTIARLRGSGNNVGYYPNAFKAVWKAVERSLYARQEPTEYGSLAATVLILADEITRDVKFKAAR